MAWTEITRRQYRRDGLRYASDLTDAEWAVIEPYLPPAKPLGRPRETDLRAVVDAILYMARTGCQWRQLPKEFPPYPPCKAISTIGATVACSSGSISNCCWRCARSCRSRGEPVGWGDRQPIGQDHRERRAARLRCGQESEGPQAAYRDRYHRLDGRSRGPSGRCARSRRRAAALSKRSAGSIPWLRHVFADSGYAGDKLRTALRANSASGASKSSGVGSSDGFEVLPRRWVVERTLLGSIAYAASPRTSKPPSPAPSRGFSSPTSEQSPDASQGIDQK